MKITLPEVPLPDSFTGTDERRHEVRSAILQVRWDSLSSYPLEERDRRRLARRAAESDTAMWLLVEDGVVVETIMPTRGDV